MRSWKEGTGRPDQERARRLSGAQPDIVQQIVQQVGELRKKFEELSQTPILLTSQIIRVYLSRMLATFYPDIYVLSFNEITSNVQIQAIGNITLQPQEKRA